MLCQGDILYNKNLLDLYNPEQEKIKDALWKYMKKRPYSIRVFASILNMTPQGLANIFRGGRMTPMVECKLRDWLEINK